MNIKRVAVDVLGGAVGGAVAYLPVALTSSLVMMGRNSPRLGMGVLGAGLTGGVLAGALIADHFVRPDKNEQEKARTQSEPLPNLKLGA